jgi:hypothetical protein
VYAFNILNQSVYGKIQLHSLVPGWAGLVLVLMAEVVAYWYMREFQYRRFLALWHVGLWYGAFLLVRVVDMVGWLSLYNLSAKEYSESASTWTAVGEILFWSSIAIGHLFFVRAILEGIKNRRKEQSSEPSEIPGSV